MDHSKLDIEAQIWRARKQRDEALGKLIVELWIGIKSIFSGTHRIRQPIPR